MTQIEKLMARLKQLQNRAVTILVIIDENGQPLTWVVQDERKLEGRVLNTAPNGAIMNETE